MAIHERPKILLWTPYAAKARVNATKYVNALPIINVGWLVADLAGVIVDTDVSVGTGPDFTIDPITLTIGQTYTVRVHYTNASGTSIWSRPMASTVFSGGFDLPAISAPTPPGDLGSPIPLALAPSYRVELEHLRGLITHTSSAGHHIRRLTSEGGTVRLRLSWFGLSLTQRDTVLAVLKESLGTFDAPGDVRGFDFSTVQPATPRPLLGTTFLPVQGTIISREGTTGVYEVVIDVVEVRP